MIRGSCTTCHDTPNVGNHSVALPIDIGLTDGSRRTPGHAAVHAAEPGHGRDPQDDRPGPRAAHRQVEGHRQVQGPGAPRPGLAPPYFHNGSAADLGEVVDFYDTRFGIGFTDREKADLVAFLAAL